MQIFAWTARALPPRTKPAADNVSLVSDILKDARSLVNNVLGDKCILTDTVSASQTETNVIIQNEVEIFQNYQFVGHATTGVFDLTDCNPKIGNSLYNTETGLTYALDGIKDETATKVTFILREVL